MRNLAAAQLAAVSVRDEPQRFESESRVSFSPRPCNSAFGQPQLKRRHAHQERAEHSPSLQQHSVRQPHAAVTYECQSASDVQEAHFASATPTHMTDSYAAVRYQYDSLAEAATAFQEQAVPPSAPPLWTRATHDCGSSLDTLRQSQPELAVQEVRRSADTVSVNMAAPLDESFALPELPPIFKASQSEMELSAASHAARLAEEELLAQGEDFVNSPRRWVANGSGRPRAAVATESETKGASRRSLPDAVVEEAEAAAHPAPEASALQRVADGKDSQFRAGSSWVSLSPHWQGPQSLEAGQLAKDLQSQPSPRAMVQRAASPQKSLADEFSELSTRPRPIMQRMTSPRSLADELAEA